MATRHRLVGGGAPGVMGTWTVTAGSVTHSLDRGKTHASKDFHDPVHKR